MAKAEKDLDNTISNQCVPVRFTEAQYDRILAKVKEGGSVTQVVREAVLVQLGIKVVPVLRGRKVVA